MIGLVLSLALVGAPDEVAEKDNDALLICHYLEEKKLASDCKSERPHEDWAANALYYVSFKVPGHVDPATIAVFLTGADLQRAADVAGDPKLALGPWRFTMQKYGALVRLSKDVENPLGIKIAAHLENYVRIIPIKR